LEEPSIATTVQGVYLYLYFAATCFGIRWPSSGEMYNILSSYPPEDGQRRLKHKHLEQLLREMVPSIILMIRIYHTK
jgi:hypothetical protein